MTITDWFDILPPDSMTDSGLKMLIYMLILFSILSAIAVRITTKGYKKKDSPTLLDMDLETDRPVPSDIPPAERIAILKIEKAKFLGAQRALSDAHKKKEIGEGIFTRLSVRYTSDVKKIEDEIEKTAREAEVSQLEQELKKMQGDYLSKIKGDEKIETPAAIPTTAPPAPPTKPVKEKKVKKEKKRKRAAVAPPTPSMPASSPAAPPSPPMPPSIGKTPPPTAIPSPPMPTPPKSGAGTTSIPAPSMPTPKPPAPAVTPSSTPEGGEGDLFAKSTSIAALRKEMLKELDRLKKFMSEQQ